MVCTLYSESAEIQHKVVTFLCSRYQSDVLCIVSVPDSILVLSHATPVRVHHNLEARAVAPILQSGGLRLRESACFHVTRSLSQILNLGLGNSSPYSFPQHHTASHGFPEIEFDNRVTHNPPGHRAISKISDLKKALKDSRSGNPPHVGISPTVSTRYSMRPQTSGTESWPLLGMVSRMEEAGRASDSTRCYGKMTLKPRERTFTQDHTLNSRCPDDWG